MRTISTGTAYGRRVFLCHETKNYEEDMFRFFSDPTNYNFKHNGRAFAIWRFDDDGIMSHLFKKFEQLKEALINIEQKLHILIYLDQEVTSAWGEDKYMNVIAFHLPMTKRDRKRRNQGKQVRRREQLFMEHEERMLTVTLDDIMNYTSTYVDWKPKNEDTTWMALTFKLMKYMYHHWMS